MIVKHLAAAAITLSALACYEDGPPNPVPTETPELPPAVEPGPTRRTVETRNPLGGRIGNLLVDGDFEMSVIIQGTQPQSGWLAFGGSNYMRGETGGLCRSGLRCGWLDPGVVVLGQGAAARDSGMVASVWAKPPPGFGCNSLSVQMLRCQNFTISAGLLPQNEEPGEDGWCFYRARLRRESTGVCMYMENDLIDGSFLIDDAAIIPDKGNVPLSSAHAIPDVAFTPLTGARRERVRAMVEYRKNRMKLGTPLTDRPDIGPR